jgi:hypothetical protein
MKQRPFRFGAMFLGLHDLLVKTGLEVVGVIVFLLAGHLFRNRLAVEAGECYSPRIGMTDHLPERVEWVELARKIAMPVLSALAAGKLKATMPVEVGPGATREDRARFTHLEALGRLLAGLAPWLELGPDESSEGRIRRELRDLALLGIDAGTDPASPDFMNFSDDAQPLVDAAFLCHALLRAPRHLWEPLPARTKANVVAAVKQTRAVKPPDCNWLLYSAVVEAFLHKAGEDWVAGPVENAILSHEEWFKGDGMYGDGSDFHWDYYNSFSIQPMLLDVLEVFGPQRPAWAALKPTIVWRARRYAAIQERMISPEGTIPPIGRSLAYRIAALHLLGQMALRHELPDGVSPAQVRCAMTAVIRRMMHAPGTFDDAGWLTIGFAGHQPFIGEKYVSTGSTYLCAAGLLPLGLAESDPFWQSPPEDWTSRRLWSGGVAPIDQAVHGHSQLSPTQRLWRQLWKRLKATR